MMARLPHSARFVSVAAKRRCHVSRMQGSYSVISRPRFVAGHSNGLELQLKVVRLEQKIIPVMFAGHCGPFKGSIGQHNLLRRQPSLETRKTIEWCKRVLNTKCV